MSPNSLRKLLQLYTYIRNNRYLNLFAINLRILLGIGFVHAGLRKIGGEPFAIIGQQGVFFEYLDALYETGFYYEFVGWLQIIAGVLLITQRFALLGAFIYFPIILNITVLTISTIGSLTPVFASLMCLGTLFLLLWDYSKWINVFSPDHKSFPLLKISYPVVSKWWIKTGLFIVILPSLSALTLKLISPNNKLLGYFGLGILALTFLIPILSFFIDEFRYRKAKKSN
ncbi:MAG: hypothetical protein JKY48_00475 [Flavobacteriales bacterium]|nr:hypothetical protein [Flavobacteriales bacterium]